MKTSGKVFLTLIILFIVIQFFHPLKNSSTAQSPHDISVAYAEPENVRTILNKACNDCHSNNTRYPWYNNVQPVAWWLASHIEDGKRSLNFNEFSTYRTARQYHRMQDIIDEVKEGDMPLGSYTLIHTDARLTPAEKTTLIDWATSVRTTMKAKYPADSLVRKK